METKTKPSLGIFDTLSSPPKVVVKTEIILIKETLIKSVLKDATTFITIVGVIGTGWLLDSSAMQWVGFLGLCMIAFSWATKGKKYTIAEARKKLDELEKT